MNLRVCSTSLRSYSSVSLASILVLAGAAACSSSSTGMNDTQTHPDASSSTDSGGHPKTEGGTTPGDDSGSENDGGNPESGGDDGSPENDGGDDSGPEPDGGGGHWTTMTLPGDHDVDEVTGIFYSSPTKGFVVTVPGDDAIAGAVLSTTATTVTGIAFDGNVDTSAGGVLGGLQFSGLVPTAAGGLVAVTDLSDLVSAPSFTGAFTNVANSQNLGIGQIAGAYFGAGFTLLAQDQNGFYKAPSAPGPNASYTDIFDPGSDPTVPDPIPSNECQDPVLVNDSFATGLTVVAFSSDASTIAYTTYSDADGVPEVCVSTDGGHSFLPTELAGKPEEMPSGVIFPNPSAPSTIIVYDASLDDATSNYVLRSVNGGTSFSSVTLPSSFATKEIQLFGSFFLADGLHGWIVGYDGDADTGLALVTTDGGQTWAYDTTGIAAATSSGTVKLHSIFALDTTHIWIGGELGALIAYTP